MLPTSGPSKGQSIHINPNFKPIVKLPLPTSTHINPLFIRPPKITRIHMNPEFLKAQQMPLEPEPEPTTTTTTPKLNKIISKSRTHIVRQMPSLKKPQLKETSTTSSKELLVLTKRKLIRVPMASTSNYKPISIDDIFSKKQRLKIDHKTYYERADIVPILKRRPGAFVARYALRRSNSVKKASLDQMGRQEKDKKLLDTSLKSVNKKLRLININGILYKSTGNKLQRKIDGSATIKQQQQQQTNQAQSSSSCSSLKSVTSIVDRAKIRQLESKPSKNTLGRTLYVRGAKYVMDPTGYKLTRATNTNDFNPISANIFAKSKMLAQHTTGTGQTVSSAVNRNLPRRIDIGGVTYIASGQSKNVFVRTNTHLVLAHLQQAKQRSVHVLRRSLTKTNKPCLIFQRLGKCAALERNKCSKVHDKQRIIVCPKFLQGLCFDPNCLLSHNNTLEKMPVCRFFLQGSCVRTDCPYLHKKLNDDSEICEDFRRGFCALAEQCNKQHIFSRVKPKVISSPHDSHERLSKEHMVSTTEIAQLPTDTIAYRYFNGDGFILGETGITKKLENSECSVAEDRTHDDDENSSKSENSEDEDEEDNYSGIANRNRKRKQLDPLPAFIPLS